MTRPEDNKAWLSDAFETVINYIEADNESDMNQYVLDLIAILRDLEYKALDEEGEVKA